MKQLLFIYYFWGAQYWDMRGSNDRLPGSTTTLNNMGLKFSSNNSVTLLTTGQEKFDDMFKAIQQAKKSIHLEYFNFRNDSIAGLFISYSGTKGKRRC